MMKILNIDVVVRLVVQRSSNKLSLVVRWLYGEVWRFTPTFGRKDGRGK